MPAPLLRAALVALAMACLGAGAAELAAPVPLQCRLAQGPWRPCVMRVQILGVAWQLELNGEQISFHHDGQGQVRMRRGAHDWVAVESRWSEEAALCWDGVCAKGDLPLD